MRRNRTAALLLCAVIATVICASSVFVFINTNHDCAGESCAVCMEINSFEALLRNMSGGFFFAAAAIVFSAAFFTSAVLFCSQNVDRLTLVSLKTKLSD